ncbi:discoidin domain-containing protein [Fredinandcohnia sp. QZ13]|uniref:discoidin domain-containing protein n=1 Tax=Fredinandcohnia sp. QZ13 TaxID=3073144 RepID=UPI00285301DD|nr:discoidin domain-containing protein [Fredinandcohnia sp. QZ13]MDR4888113.1 discoidin domain-containing protein [Fredinandcohnia sp. QZ13]
MRIQRLKRSFSLLLVFCLIQSLFIPVMGTTTSAEENPVNLALGKKVTKSSDCKNCNPAGPAEQAVDGNSGTIWTPLSGDVADHNVWIEINLGDLTEINEVVLKNLNIPYIQSYEISYQGESDSYIEIARKSENLSSEESVIFESVLASRVKINFNIDGSKPREFILGEIEIYDQKQVEEENPIDSNLDLAYKKTATASSHCGSCGTYPSNAVDGDPSTAWRALSGDYNDDGQHWLVIDLGKKLSFNKTIQTFNLDAVDRYELLYSDDNKTWTSIYQNKLVVNKEESAIFDRVKARYLKVNVHAKKASVPLIYDLKLFNTDEAPVPPAQNPLKSVYLNDETTAKYEVNSDLIMQTGDTKQVSLYGIMYDGGLLPEDAQIIFTSSRPEIAQVAADGTITAISGGVTVLTGEATVESITQSTNIFVVVDDPEARVVDTTLLHEKIQQKIGVPAIISPEDDFPQVQLSPHLDGKVSMKVFDPEGKLHQNVQKQITKGEEYKILIPKALKEGKYEVQLRFDTKNIEPVYDTLYFHVINLEKLTENQSKMAFLNEEGKLIYTTDIRGNQIMDFSNSGYMGGGVQIPDVQARVVVDPADGDDTERIQKAIDLVSQLPIQKNGFRGAVLLKKGTFEIGGTLKIQDSGVVLRGEGDGEDGTILFATGKTKRNIVEVGDKEAAPQIQTETKQNIVDLYVPVGSRSFHVDDHSGYKVGDKIIIRRFGNSSWIHDIDMDQIPERDGTVQWEPFTLDFDRVITEVKGNIITIDAPVPNAIERKYGGAEIYKYDDSGRLANIGVENIRVEIEFDSTVTAIHNDEEYYADEEKAETFLTFEYTKNAWMRNVTGLYLSKYLVNLGRHTKWITVQDSNSLEMVSLITGSRRYPFNYVGQLSLTQRVYSEKARHAFIFDRQMSGPNVILDSVSEKTYARSEPHQRWATGGLFDNVTGNANAMDRAYYGTGHGWAGANFVFWNHTGNLAVQQPPTAQNYAIGLIGKREEGDFKTTPDNLREDGYWEAEGRHVKPRSLYHQQLHDRLSSKAIENIKETPVGGGELDTPK